MASMEKAAAISKERVKAMLRLALANEAIVEAEAIADLLIQADPPFTDHLYNACMSGMVVSYCRPFVEADGLGTALDLATFKGTEPALDEHRAVHGKLMLARNKIVAHHDFTYGKSRFEGGTYARHPGRVTFTLAADEFSIETSTYTPPPPMLQAAKRLFQFQQKRVEAYQDTFAAALLLSKNGKFGKYTYTLD